MDIIRRNTDYALRAMLRLGTNYKDRPVSARLISQTEGIPAQLTPKLLQKLQKADLVDSVMGPKGGFTLAQPPSKITIARIIKVIQGPLQLNQCLRVPSVCKNKQGCPISVKLHELQSRIDDFFENLTLEDVLKASQTAVSQKKGSNS